MTSPPVLPVQPTFAPGPVLCARCNVMEHHHAADGACRPFVGSWMDLWYPPAHAVLARVLLVLVVLLVLLGASTLAIVLGGFEIVPIEPLAAPTHAPAIPEAA